MKGYCCDRCGTWFESGKGETMSLHPHLHGDDHAGDKTIHLCNRCASSLHNWQTSGVKGDQAIAEMATRIRERLHKLWTASDGPGYVKKDWQDFEKMLAQAFTDMWPL